MDCGKFKILLILLKIGLIFSCGIKKPPKPIPPPQYELKRIGSNVFLIPKTQGLKAEGFVPLDGFLVREDPSRFCFKVSSPQSKKVLVCIEEAVSVRPRFELQIKKDRLVVRMEEEGRYRVYPYRDGKLVPTPLMEVEGGSIELKRDYKKKVFGITKVVGKVESEPVVVKVPPLKPPEPDPPRDLRYIIRGGKIYIYWWGGEDLRFLVYRNRRLLTPEPIVRNYFVDKLPESEAIYEIVSVNRFGGRSKPARIVYRP